MMRRGSPRSLTAAPLGVSRLLSGDKGLVPGAIGHALQTLIPELPVPSASALRESRVALALFAVV